MDKITQTARYRQSLIYYAEKHGVTKAAIRDRTKRQYIYRWRKRYDGTLQSLEDRSHRPHSRPNQHTQAEQKRLAVRQHQYNAFSMRPLNWRSPKQVLVSFFSL